MWGYFVLLIFSFPLGHVILLAFRRLGQNCVTVCTVTLQPEEFQGLLACSGRGVYCTYVRTAFPKLECRRLTSLRFQPPTPIFNMSILITSSAIQMSQPWPPLTKSFPIGMASLATTSSRPYEILSSYRQTTDTSIERNHLR
jgi:hypothetical protein